MVFGIFITMEFVHITDIIKLFSIFIKLLSLKILQEATKIDTMQLPGYGEFSMARKSPFLSPCCSYLES